MSGHPIEDYAEAGPGAVKRVLGDRQEFNVREAEIAAISRQLLGQLAVAQPATTFVRPPAP